MQNLILERVYLGEVGFWPHVPSDTNVAKWLANFTPDEQVMAEAILNQVVYLNEKMIDQLFLANWRELVAAATLDAGTYSDRVVAAKTFRDKVLITHPTDEPPNATDSGYAFSRRARNLLGIEQSRIVEPPQALALAIESGDNHIVFLDDITASGDQFEATWNRKYSIGSSEISFADSFTAGKLGSCHYAPVIATWKSQRRLKRLAPRLDLQPAHLLGAEYSAKSFHNIYWASSERSSQIGLLRRATVRAGYPADELFGHEDLGLALSFHHQTPDATMPIIHSSRAGWAPLFPRST